MTLIAKMLNELHPQQAAGYQKTLMRISPEGITPLRYDLAVYSGQTDYLADSPSSHVSVAYRGAGFSIKAFGNDRLLEVWS